MVRATISTSQNPVFVEGWNPGIPVAAKEPDLAWKLMALWTSPEIQVLAIYPCAKVRPPWSIRTVPIPLT